MADGAGGGVLKGDGWGEEREGGSGDADGECIAEKVHAVECLTLAIESR